jgi:hypothetical protein
MSPPLGLCSQLAEAEHGQHRRDPGTQCDPEAGASS